VSELSRLPLSHAAERVGGEGEVTLVTRLSLLETKRRYCVRWSDEKLGLSIIPTRTGDLWSVADESRSRHSDHQGFWPKVSRFLDESV
jgi:hypothetical protein